MLSEEDLQKRIVGCGDGPASFNAEMTQMGGSVVSVDPIYAFSAEQIAGRIDEVAEVVMAQVCQNAHRFVWKNIPDRIFHDTVIGSGLDCSRGFKSHRDGFMINQNTGISNAKSMFQIP